MSQLSPPQIVFYQELGLIDYQEAWDYQEEIFSSVVATKLYNRDLVPGHEKKPVSHYLLFCQHPQVFTLGKSSHLENLLASSEILKQKGISFYKINRGGDITYHGPGQIVGYPILDLDEFFTDIHLYLRKLEEMIILTLAD